MIHILDYKSCTFDYNPEILLQYVDVTRIFQKFVSKTDYVKNKLKKDGKVFYTKIEDHTKMTLESFCNYLDNNHVEILVCNIEIFEECYIKPNFFFNKISQKYPNIKFIVSSDETFFNYTQKEYNHKNVFYITNGIINPYSFLSDLNTIPNFTSYYILNNYLQEDYNNFIRRLFHTTFSLVRNKKYNFYNGVHKPHRLKCYELIKNNELLEEGYFSYADFALLTEDNDYKKTFIGFLDFETEEEYDEYLKKFKIPFLYDSTDSDPNIFVPFLIPPQTSLQSYISITTETFFNEGEYSKNLVFSEKSFKSFYGFNIPLIIGQTTSLKYLKDLGFDLFEDLFDITHVSTKKEIFEQVDKNFKKIKNMSKAELHEFYNNNIDRINSNFELLTDRLKERDIENLNNFLNE